MNTLSSKWPSKLKYLNFWKSYKCCKSQQSTVKKLKQISSVSTKTVTNNCHLPDFLCPQSHWTFIILCSAFAQHSKTFSSTFFVVCATLPLTPNLKLQALINFNYLQMVPKSHQRCHTCNSCCSWGVKKSKKTNFFLASWHSMCTAVPVCRSLSLSIPCSQSF